MNSLEHNAIHNTIMGGIEWHHLCSNPLKNFSQSACDLVGNMQGTKS